MGQPKKFQLRQLNGYSWSILVAFICATFSMQYHSSTFLEAFFQSLPLIILAIYWCEKSAYYIKQPESNLERRELFNRDFFIIGFSFLLGCLISLIFAYNNTDAKGWWSLIISFITLYGLFFSLIFSIIALLIKNHKIYTMTFSFLILLLVSFGSFFPHYLPLPFLRSVETFYIITGLILIIHCLVAIGCKVTGSFSMREQAETHNNKFS